MLRVRPSTAVVVFIVALALLLPGLPSGRGGPSAGIPHAAEPTLGERVLQAADGRAISRPAGVGPAVALPSARAIVSAPPLPSPAWVDRTVEISHLSLYPGMLAYDPAISATVEYDGYFGTTWAYTATG